MVYQTYLTNIHSYEFDRYPNSWVTQIFELEYI
jgi:hypothetical protein